MIEGLVVRDLAVHQDDRGAFVRDRSTTTSIRGARFVAKSICAESCPRLSAGLSRPQRHPVGLLSVSSAGRRSSASSTTGSRLPGRVSKSGCQYSPEPRPSPGSTFRGRGVGLANQRLSSYPPGVFHGWKSLNRQRDPRVRRETRSTNREKPDESAVSLRASLTRSSGAIRWEVRGR